MINQFAERGAGAGQVPLADHLVQAVRAHPHRERGGRPGSLLTGLVEETGRLPVVARHATQYPGGALPPTRASAQPTGGSGLASMPASLRWASVMGVGAPVSGSRPEAALGKAITSRMLAAPDSSMSVRSQPNAIPPCGGGPYLNASSRKPNCDRASSGVIPITSKTCC